MGIHFVEPPLFAPGISPSTPEILLYAPRSDGSLELVGVEYWQADADEDLGTSGDRPSVFGAGFDGPMLDREDAADPLRPARLGGRAQPSGVFTQWDPAVDCRKPLTITGPTSGSDR